MLKTIFSKKVQTKISLFLGINRIAICLLESGVTRLLAQATVSSDLKWPQAFAALVDEHKLHQAQVSVVLSRDFYQTFDIEKPKVEDDELMATLPFAIKDLVSESIFDLVVDYYDVPFQQHKGEQITAVCVPKQRVMSIRDMILIKGMKLKEIITEELALTRLLGVSEEVNLLLSQQKSELVLTVVKEGQLFFSHRLRGFNELLPQPLSEDENTLLDGLSLELQRALDYMSSQLRITSISHLYLALVCPDLALLAEKLGSYLGRNVQPFGEKDQYDFINIIAYGPLMGGDGK
ncbi:hypothetical protein [Psychromonas antarctica]|jgi:MSHA biogenesis protein MshI|uniref:hypothetical protein n=1 Tax=Psychromonas antarctica TaxID=67573 RepID=UPI001EE8F726|nr:hypothetical protein [Psychromonas antarctica]MCG6200988.1 hypothetical protein [Psychromonas antarctica]